MIEIKTGIIIGVKILAKRNTNTYVVIVADADNVDEMAWYKDNEYDDDYAELIKVASETELSKLLDEVKYLRELWIKENVVYSLDYVKDDTRNFCIGYTEILGSVTFIINNIEYVVLADISDINNIKWDDNKDYLDLIEVEPHATKIAEVELKNLYRKLKNEYTILIGEQGKVLCTFDANKLELEQAKIHYHIFGEKK